MQAQAEMREKIKILENEVDILRNESMAKDGALSKEKLIQQQACNTRDQLRLETNKSHAIYRQKQELVCSDLPHRDGRRCFCIFVLTVTNAPTARC